MRFRKKPIEIEAFQWTGENTTELLHWIDPDLPIDATACDLTIKTLEGEMKATRGDWIIKCVQGKFYPASRIFSKRHTKELKNESF